MRSTRANRIHSTCPTTATRMRAVCYRRDPASLDAAPLDARTTLTPSDAGRFTDDGCRGDDPAVRDVLRRACRRGARRSSAGGSAATVPTTRSRRRSSVRCAPTSRLRHGEHLRAWVLTIATRVAIDAHGGPASRPTSFPSVAAPGRPPRVRGACVPHRRAAAEGTGGGRPPLRLRPRLRRRSPPPSTRALTPRVRRRRRACGGCEGG